MIDQTEGPSAEPEAPPSKPRRSINYYQVLFFLYLAVVLLVMIFYVPPFQKVDEPAHFHRAVSLTNLNLVCVKDEETGRDGFPMKRKYAELQDILHVWDVYLDYNHKFDTDWLNVDVSDPKYNDEVSVYDFCSLPVPGYLPNALGVLLGKPFPGPLVSFYFSRLFGALFFVLALILALRIVPERYRLIIYVYAVIPTVLHQVSAINYDAVQLSLVPLIFAYLTRFIVDEGPIRPRQLLIFMALLWWLINIRLLAFYPMILLFFLIDPAKIAPRYSRYLMIAAAFLIFTVLTTSLLNSIYLPYATDSSPDEGAEINATAQVNLVLEDPWRFVETSYRTLSIQGDHLLHEAIGVFGWEDYYLGFFPYWAVTFIAGIVLYQLARNEKAVLRPSQLFILLATILMTAGSVFFSLYAVWSAVGADEIAGLQGRYFLGLLPFSIFWCSQAVATLGRERSLQLLVLVFGLILVYSMVRAVDLRYY